MCAQSIVANLTDPQPAPEENGLVTVGIAFPKHLPDATQGKSLIDVCLTVSGQSVHHGGEGLQLIV